MTATCTNAPFTSAPSTRPTTAFGWFFEMMAVRRSRRDLADAEDHILSDVGITRKAAEIEASRPLWDVPGHWRA